MFAFPASTDALIPAGSAGVQLLNVIAPVAVPPVEMGWVRFPAVTAMDDVVTVKL